MACFRFVKAMTKSQVVQKMLGRPQEYDPTLHMYIAQRRRGRVMGVLFRKVESDCGFLKTLF